MGFWHVYFGIYGGGQADIPVAPTDGWVACGLNRVAVADGISRVVWANSQGK